LGFNKSFHITSPCYRKHFKVVTFTVQARFKLGVHSPA